MIKQDTDILQHWMKTVITSPGKLPQKLQKAHQLFGFNEHDVVAQAGNASVYERLNVYTTGYVLRLLDCMYADFPVLKKFLGAELFDHFAKAYLASHPSTSFTLYELGSAFPAFLERTKPSGVTDEMQKAYLDLPIALARLERAVNEVLRAAGTEDDTIIANDFDAADMLLYPLQVAASPCLRLLEMPFPILQFYDQVRTKEDYDLPPVEKTFVAVSRKNYRLVMETLLEWQFVFLKACAEPVSLAEATNTTAATCNMPASAILAELYLWLPVLRNNGFVDAIY